MIGFKLIRLNPPYIKVSSTMCVKKEVVMNYAEDKMIMKSSKVKRL